MSGTLQTAHGDRPEVGELECVGVQTAPEDFDTKEFFEPDIAEMNVPAKVFQQGKLAGFAGRFEHDGFEPEPRHEAFREPGIQISILIKQPDSPGTLSCFDDEL